VTPNLFPLKRHSAAKNSDELAGHPTGSLDVIANPWRTSKENSSNVAFGDKADIEVKAFLLPLLTQSGHRRVHAAR